MLQAGATWHFLFLNMGSWFPNCHIPFSMNIAVSQDPPLLDKPKLRAFIFVFMCMGTMAQIDRVVKLKFYSLPSRINWAKAPLKASLAFCPELLRLEPWHMATAPLDHQTSAAKSPAFSTYAIALALEQRIKPGRIFKMAEDLRA